MGKCDKSWWVAFLVLVTLLPSTTCFFSIVPKKYESFFNKKTALGEHSSRREVIGDCMNRLFIAGATIVTASSSPSVTNAYTPDPDPVRESLYFVSRVQEATVQQGTYVEKYPLRIRFTFPCLS